MPERPPMARPRALKTRQQEAGRTTKEEWVRNLLRFTSWPPQKIAEWTDTNLKTVKAIDHKFDSRNPLYNDELTHEYERAARKNSQTRVATSNMPTHLKKKIVSENIGLFMSPVINYLKERPWIRQKYKVGNRDVINEFVVHCMEKLDLFDANTAQLSTFIYHLFPNFMSNYLREKEQQSNTEEKFRSEKPSVFAKGKNRLPRGWGLIPVNLREIWSGLGLRLETAIRFGAEETSTALSHLVRNAMLTKAEGDAMTLLIEGLTPKQISKRRDITEQRVSQLKFAAQKKIRIYIKLQRANGESF